MSEAGQVNEGGWPRAAWAGARDLVRAGLSAVVPVECPGCGQWDETLCERCHAMLYADAQRCEEDIATWDDPALSAPVFSIGPYRGPLRNLTLEWKSHRRTDLLPIMARAAHHHGAWLGKQLDGAGPLAVVPAPSGWKRHWQRRLVVADLADHFTEGLAHTLPGGTQVASIDLLRRTRAGQSGRGARARVAGRHQIAARTALPAGWRAVVVDDVVTTGSTLAGCVSALEAAGAQVVAGFVVAATPPPQRTAAKVTNIDLWKPELQ